MRRITAIRARNFKSLADVDIELAPLSVLIGPNGSGKTNVLNVLRFLRETAQRDLEATVESWGGMDSVRRCAPDVNAQAHVTLGISALISSHASDSAPDDYRLDFWPTAQRRLARKEALTFKRVNGPGRRITVQGHEYSLTDDDRGDTRTGRRAGLFRTTSTTALATLPKMAPEQGGQGIADIADFLAEVFVFEPDVEAVRAPSRLRGAVAQTAQRAAAGDPWDDGTAPVLLRPDAGNLGEYLLRLAHVDPGTFHRIEADLGRCLPGAVGIDREVVGGAGAAVELLVRERGLSRPIPLSEASWGTVRLLAMLTVLHQPAEHSLIAIEELDAGLHPYALDLLVDRMREAAGSTQVLVASHSPTLVNRLHPEEMVICDRDPTTGESIIPARTSEDIRRALDAAPDFAPGELWFGGVLGGVPDGDPW